MILISYNIHIHIYKYIYILCETWSRARAVQCLHPHKRAPRVIRTSTDLWGLPHLRISQLLQIFVGNILRCFTLEAFLPLVTRRGVAVVERPIEPEEEHFASIWHLPIMLALRELPGVDLWAISQGLFGAAAKKPTNLLCLNLPNICLVLAKHRITPTPPKSSSIGRTSQGSWATSALKEYPPAMNKALAKTFFAAISAIPTTVQVEIDAEFLTTCTAMTVTHYGQVMGQDFAG